MGAAASVYLDTKAFTAEQIADFVGSLGPAYEAYKERIVFNGLTGALVSSLSDADLNEFLDELEITSSIHRKNITAHLKNIYTRRILG